MNNSWTQLGSTFVHSENYLWANSLNKTCGCPKFHPDPQHRWCSDDTAQLGSLCCISKSKSLILSIGLYYLLNSKTVVAFSNETYINKSPNVMIIWEVIADLATSLSPHSIMFIMDSCPCHKMAPWTLALALLWWECLMKDWWPLWKFTAHSVCVHSFWGCLSDALHKHYIDINSFFFKLKYIHLVHVTIIAIFYSHKQNILIIWFYSPRIKK